MAVTQNNIKPFDGKGYSNWEFRIKLLLEHHSVLETISTDPPDENEVAALATFKKNDVKARNLIINCLADNVLEMVKGKNTAKEIIEVLKGTYLQSGVAYQVQLQRKLRNLKFNGKNSLNDFIVDFEKTVYELRNCGGLIQDTEVISQILAAMPNDYQSVTTALDVLFCQGSSVTLDFVKSKLLAEETRQKNSEGEIDNAQAFAGMKTNKYGTKYRHGFQKNSSKMFPFNCYYCGVKGHKKSECPKRKQCNVTKEENEGEEVCFVSSVEAVSSHKLMNNDQDFVFVVDSGATNHLVNKDVGQYMTNVENISYKINVAKSGESIIAKRQGTLHIQVEGGRNITIKDVLECENLSYNLLSVRKIEEKGLKVSFENKAVKIMNGASVITEGKLKGNLYTLHFIIPKAEVHVSVEDQDLWHRRMGHSSLYPVSTICQTCLEGKQTKLPYKNLSEKRKPKRILEVVTSDVCGPITPVAYDGKKYFVTFVDQYSHFTVCYLLQQKSEVVEKFKSYEAMVEAKFGHKIERLRCDNGGEYDSKEFQAFCSQKGIKIEYTVPYNPQQNGVSERYNRTIMERARCLIFDTKIDKCFWNEAVQAAIYLINRTSTSVLENKKTPAEIWYGVKPNLNKIRVFGCDAYVHTPKEQRSGKLDSRSRKMLMMGYTDNGYRIWDPEQDKIIRARDVIFDETKRSEQTLHFNLNEENNDNENNPNRQSHENKQEQESTSEIEEDIVENIRHRRTSKLPKRFEDFDMNLDESLLAALSADFCDDVPESYDDAIKTGKGWKEAIDSELDVLHKNETWEIVPYPKNDKVIDSRWVFKEKEIDGQLVKKARLVARGYKQCDSSYEMYAPVVRMMTIRILFALSVQKDLCIAQLDVKCAFLNGDLKECVYMEVPKGLVVKDLNMVCKLKRSLYGLRQAPKCWYEKLNISLIKMGLKRSQSDPCLYYDNDTYLLVHVDDLILFSKFKNKIYDYKQKLMSEFEMRDLSNNISSSNYTLKFLGLEVTITDTYLFIQQKDLITKILSKFNMLECKELNIPIQPKTDLEVIIKSEPNENLPYRKLIGYLMYVMLGSRPDLSYSISYFSQFQNCFTQEHWVFLKQVLRYLKFTQNYGLKYVKSIDKDVPNSNNIMSAFVDADFANSKKDRKSVSGFSIKVFDNFVFWKSKKQATVALSSAEAEYIALSGCITECIFIAQLLKEILNQNIFPIEVFEDNQSTIKMAHTLETKRTKHIDVKHHFIRDCIEKNKVYLTYVSTSEQIADIFTKALPAVKFKYFKEKLNVTEK